jgi:hypothetical protein
MTLRVLRGEKQRTLWLTIISLRYNGRARDGLVARLVIGIGLAFFVTIIKRRSAVVFREGFQPMTFFSISPQTAYSS